MPSGHQHGSLLSWSFVLAFVLAAAAFLYCRGWYVLRNALPVISIWRRAAFMGGLLSLWIVLGSPVAHLDHELLTAHMVQHLLLMTIAAPLILSGAPAVTLPHGLPHRFISPVVSALRRCSTHDRTRILIHPVSCWFAGTGVVIWWHIPFAFDLGMRSEAWHRFEQATFLAGGLLFWWEVLRPSPSLARWPRWSVPLYLFSATLPCDALSAFLTFCGHVVYRSYLSGPRHIGFPPLQDQEFAGALMWVWVTFAYMIPAVGITIQLLMPRLSSPQIEVV